MVTNFVKHKIVDYVLIIELNNIENDNKLTIPIMKDIMTLLNDNENNLKCKVIMIAGIKGAFCGGGDLGDASKLKAKEFLAFADVLVQLHTMIAKYPKLVIGAIDGYVRGGGFSLLETFDLAIASSQSTFSLPEINHGVAPMISILSMRNNTTRKICMENIIFGKEINAFEALKYGFINKIVDTDNVIDEALNYIKCFMNKNSDAFAMVKRYYNMTSNISYEQQLEIGKHTLISMLK